MFGQSSLSLAQVSTKKKVWHISISRYTIMLGIAAFVFFAIGSWWGMPYATAPERVQSWGIDDESPLGPLTEIHNIIEPKPNQWLSYPLMYSFLAAAAYAPYMIFQLLTDGLTEISATYPFGLTDPVGTLQTLTVIAHLVSACMGALAVAATYDIGETLWDKRTGLLTCILALFSFPLTYYARNGNVDATALAFLALATAAFCRVVLLGLSRERALWLGFFVGCTLATKESSIGVILAMPVILLYRQARSVGSSEGGLWAGHFWKATAWGVLAAFLAFGFGSGLFVDPRRYVAHIRYLRNLLEVVARSTTAVAYTYPYTFSGHLGYLGATLHNLMEALSLPGFLLAVAGIISVMQRRSAGRVLALLPLTYLIYLFVSYRLVQVRYLMPATFLLLPLVAHAVMVAWDARSLIVRSVGVLCGVLVIGISLLHAVDLTYQMLYDSRYAAAEWLSAHSTAGTKIEYFGPASKLPALQYGVVTTQATEYHGMYVQPQVDEAKVQEILASWQERNPDYVLLIPDHTNLQPIPYSHTVPPQLYERMMRGELDYKLVAFFQTPSLFPWLGQPLLDYPVVNPPVRIFARREE